MIAQKLQYSSWLSDFIVRIKLGRDFRESQASDVCPSRLSVGYLPERQLPAIYPARIIPRRSQLVRATARRCRFIVLIA
jgi:hypothetical protein